ncbi:MAG: RNA polymerase factor sigma-54 [Sphaerochaetaceae bacterium]
MGPQLSLGLKQQLKLSPQLIQSLELMALPLTELQQRIQTAIESNPALEIPENNTFSLDNMKDMDRKRDEMDYYEGSHYDSEASDRAQAFMENTFTVEETLQDHLLSQLGCIPLDPEAYKVGEVLITNLDDNGFFREDPALLLKKEQLPFKDQIISLIQSLDPPGVGVMNWKESLIVQAKLKKMKEPELKLFASLVNENLELMRSNKKEQVMKNLAIDEEELDALFDFLKTLSPYPGQAFSSGPQQFVIPDLSIHQDNGKLVLSMNNSSLPELTISPDFVDMEAQLKNHDKETKSYIQQQIRDANLLITQIQMRNQTLLKVGQCLLVEQKDFFLNGPKHLKPLTQKEVADQIGVHETTVSRISTAKYLDTDWGIIPIKQLFSNAVGEEGQSKSSVKELVKEIIENYQGEKALSDQKISDMLKEKGVSVARRTVSKYRGELNIDSSFIRGV